MIYHILKIIWTNIRTRWLFLFDKSPILIYQMGKVGSSTVYQSLLKADTERTIYHFHSINQKVISNHRKNNLKFIKEKKYNKILHGVEFADVMNKRISRGKTPFDVITLVREPLSRNLSAFFQNAYRWIDNFEEKLKNGEITAEELVELFFKKKDFHHRSLTWIETEIEEVLDVDVYTIPFDIANGFQIYASKKARVLLIRMEDLDKMGKEIQDFLCLEDNFVLKNSNVGGNKFYSEAYAKFKQLIDLPTSYIDDLHGSKYAKHFYTTEELAAIRAKWMN